MAETMRWEPANGWAGIATPGRGGVARGDAGVRIEALPDAPIVSIVARAGRREDLARLVAGGLGGALPAPGRLGEGRDGILVWSGPDHWLAITRDPMPEAFLRDLRGVAAVTDQSSARALLAVSGPDARDALAKGFAIDLHPNVFALGHTAVTSVAHISAQIWQREAGCYHIAVPRSFASSFWSWLLAASAGYGYDVG